MNDKITEAYLNMLNRYSTNKIISEEFHRQPILGWNADYFAKIMSKMILISVFIPEN